MKEGDAPAVNLLDITMASLYVAPEAIQGDNSKKMDIYR